MSLTNYISMASAHRNSSVECFRIIATFLVLILHFNGSFITIPEYFSGFNFNNVTQSIIVALSIPCVNCFLVITGWYGIKLNWKHVWTIWSVLAFIYVSFYTARVILLAEQFSLFHLVRDFLAVGYPNHYINNYLLLLFLSPMLNLFINKYGKLLLPWVIAFWLIEIVFDWILENPFIGFGHGYHITHYILMYFLGRIAYIFKDNICFKLKSRIYILYFTFGVAIITGIYFVSSKDFAYAYSNPINIIIAFCLFLAFERKVFYSKFLNYIAQSTLAVYIIHCTPPIITKLYDICPLILREYGYGRYIIFMSIAVICLFVFSVLFDQIRRLFMPRLGIIVCKWLDKITNKFYFELS